MLPRFVKAAAVVTEDRGYWTHKGVRWQLVARALKLDMAKERFVYGGSTITQQLVKNLYLTREKTLARKLEEAIIAMQMERTFSKDEILTLYINVVEYGPDIYGVKKASRFYFAKQPWELSPLEAAFIMGLKPWPRSGFRQWEKGELSSYWVDRCHKILEMMHRREGAITAEEAAAMAPYQPRFRPAGASFSGGRAYVPPAAPGAPGGPDGAGPPLDVPPPATVPE
jgi:membrane peptidoglycan carboxypeptidase